jgi:hypothetical protein
MIHAFPGLIPFDGLSKSSSAPAGAVRGTDCFPLRNPHDWQMISGTQKIHERDPRQSDKRLPDPNSHRINQHANIALPNKSFVARHTLALMLIRAVSWHLSSIVGTYGQKVRTPKTPMVDQKRGQRSFPCGEPCDLLNRSLLQKQTSENDRYQSNALG